MKSSLLSIYHFIAFQKYKILAIFAVIVISVARSETHAEQIETTVNSDISGASSDFVPNQTPDLLTPPNTNPGPHRSKAELDTELLDRVISEIEYNARRVKQISVITQERFKSLALELSRPFLDRSIEKSNTSGKQSRGPGEGEVERMVDNIYSFNTPPIKRWTERPVEDPPGPMAEVLRKNHEVQTLESYESEADILPATRARQLLDRLEVEGNLEKGNLENADFESNVGIPSSDLVSEKISLSLDEEDSETIPPQDLLRRDFELDKAECIEKNIGVFQIKSEDWKLSPAKSHGLKNNIEFVNRIERGDFNYNKTSGLADLSELLSASPKRLPDGSVFFPKLSQYLFQIRTAPACLDKAPLFKKLTGKVSITPSYSGLIQASQLGRIEQVPDGLPVVGMKFRKGQPMGLLYPVLTSTERGEKERELAELRSQIIFKELEIARMRDFLVVPFRTGRMLFLRLELDGLRKQREVLIAGLDKSEVLRSPIDGVVSSTHVVNGQIVEAGETLWQVHDHQTLGVRAVSFADVNSADIKNAWAMTASGDVLELDPVGESGQLLNQGVQLHFDIRVPSESLRIDTPVSVFISFGDSAPLVVVPKSAVVRDDSGRTTVWEHIGDERFMSRPVRTAPLNGVQIAILEGILEGARIVYKGGYALNQTR